MLKLIYDPECPLGMFVSDADLGGEIAHLAIAQHGGNFTNIYRTSAIFFAIRLAIQEGILSRDLVRIYFKDTEVVVNKYGAIVDWPAGFCDIEQRMSQQILSNALKMRRQEREDAKRDAS